MKNLLLIVFSLLATTPLVGAPEKYYPPIRANKSVSFHESPSETLKYAYEETYPLAVGLEYYRNAVGRWPESLTELKQLTKHGIDFELLADAKFTTISEKKFRVDVPGTEPILTLELVLPTYELDERERRFYSDTNFRIEVDTDYK